MLLNCGVGECSWTTRRSNQSMLEEISSEYSLEGLMVKLKPQYFGHLMQRTQWKRPWCWKRLKAGEGDDRRWEGWMTSPTCWTWVWASSGRWWWTGKPGVLQSVGSQRVGCDWATELNWMTSKEMLSFSAAKCEKALWRKVLRVVCEREDFAGPGASLGKAVLDEWGRTGRKPGAASGVLSDGLWNKRNVRCWRLLDAWGPCATSSRRAACAVCFRLRSRSVEPPTQGSHGQCAAGHTLWFLLPIGHWLDLTKGRRDGNLHRASRKPQMCGQILLPSNLAGLWDYLLRFWYWRYFIFKEVKELEYLVKYPEF